jgi:uncharacterized membrane protein
VSFACGTDEEKAMQTAQGSATDYTLIFRRNGSLSASGRRWFFLSILAVSFGIATAWAVNGAWYVLPFAGLEMAVLYLALMVIARHGEDHETITIDGDRVVVERTRMGRTVRHEFNRHWARVVLAGAGRKSALWLRSHGREVEIGEFLSDEQRKAVANDLRRRLGNI